jgi:AmiR/NasT family two-component response regulator
VSRVPAAALVGHPSVDEWHSGRVADDQERIADLEAEAIILDATMEHRSVIEQAKGVLMSKLQCSPEAALAVLVAASQRENVKLRDLAGWIAEAQDEQT